MIFLHGRPEKALVWRARIDAFASEGRRCIAPDMRGYPYGQWDYFRFSQTNFEQRVTDFALKAFLEPRAMMA
jgi:pimeloyl-ACP methyl ester carboxylesterase